MTEIKVNVLKPGLLVALKTTVRGGVAYVRKDIDTATVDDAKVERWETEKRIENREEFEKATVARSKARSAISSICSSSSFGLICPADQEEKLDAAIREAKGIALAHNADATSTHLDVFVIVGRIAQTDEEAAKAISNEVAELLDQMKSATLVGNVEKIREAANKARELGQILSDDVGKKVSAAIEEARKNARELVKRIEKDGEKAEDVIKDLYTQRISAARSFLDLDEGQVQHAAPVTRQVEVV